MATEEMTADPDDFHTKSQAFMAWLAAQPNATISPAIKLADYRVRRAGRGIEAVADIPADADLFSIPRGAILNVQNSDLPSKLPGVFASAILDNHDNDDDDENKQQGTTLTPWTALILVMIYEHLQPHSPWKPYLDILPRSFDTLMFWSNAELAQLQGCAVVDKIGKAGADAEFRRTVVPIVRQHSDIFYATDAAQSGPLDDTALLALAHRMGSTIMAYAFDIGEDRAGADGERPVDEEGFVTDDEDDDEAALPKGMVPLADMLNADAPPNASLFSGPNTLTMKALTPIRKGAEILNDYGALPRGDLVRRYGYLTRNYAAYDCVEVTLGEIVAAVEAHGRVALAEGEMEERLAFLERRGVLDEGFDVVWPGQSEDGGYWSPGLACVVRTLLVGREGYRLPAGGGRAVDVPLEDMRCVMVPLLEARLAQYAGDIDGDAELLRDSSVTGRLRMAVGVRHGEMKLLRAALRSLDEKSSDGEEPRNKKQRLG